MSGKRTIEITEEQYQFLTKLAVIMKTQPNRGTQFPLFCIFEKDEDNVNRLINCFFTEKEMIQHLNIHEDELNKPFTHIRSAAYNEEFRQLMKFIVSLDELVLPEHENRAYE